jgi:hypothetical protein
LILSLAIFVCDRDEPLSIDLAAVGHQNGPR